jgi:membrane protease YdiL (CAAX protease family)
VLGIPTRLLYGGITEELLLRWGFMTLVVWLVWRIFQKRRTTPTNGSFIAAILFSALIFALGHLPVALILFPDAIVPVALFVILANSAFGLVCGYLYWKRGLESAISAHMFGHIVLVSASYAGDYF